MGKFKQGVRRFMTGRYGTDKLNVFILGSGVVLSLINVFISLSVLNLALTLCSYGLMVWAIFRTFSRNTYKRYRENRRFLMFWNRLKDRKHKYYDCPKCRQPVRVPRGKGKILITCPKCKEKFQKRT